MRTVQDLIKEQTGILEESLVTIMQMKIAEAKAENDSALKMSNKVFIREQEYVKSLSENLQTKIVKLEEKMKEVLTGEASRI